MSHRRLLARVVATALATTLSVGCGANEHPPDQFLQDSLGLEGSDQVFRVELAAESNRETATPSEVRVPPGAFVEFVTTDRRLHTVEFSLDDTSAAGAEFLRDTGQDASPPLLELGSRFVVSFADAPTGRYPYLVEGNGEPVRGVVVVGTGEDER